MLTTKIKFCTNTEGIRHDLISGKYAFLTGISNLPAFMT